LIAGFVGVLAALYLQVRVPQPGARDISRSVSASTVITQQQVATILGKVDSTPRLTRSQRIQFWLKAAQLNKEDTDQPVGSGKSVTGRLYVTVPLQQAELHPGQKVRVTGSLYRPKSASNPQAFDFQMYLKHEGGFAGLNGYRLTVLSKGQPWGWWAVRQRIIRAQARWLGDPHGPLVSAMVLGNRAVDLPFEVRDEFTQVGLAHALAASGFQTSLILSVVLVLARRLSHQQQFGLGAAALVIFACLSGFEPAVLRAVLMGIAGLVALVTERQSKPVSLLLVVATILLLLNPLWIWDLGFQFSFLATLGLIVTMPALIQRLDWMPPAIATLLAVPIAAFLWTLPLQLYTFGLVAPYSLIANIVTTPLISIITIGGFISGLVGLIWPLIGSALAWLLYYPSYLLTALVHFFSQLPGNSVAVGTIDLWQLVILYGLLCSVWLWPWWQRRWLLVSLVMLGLVLVPTWQTQANIFRVTVLATSDVPVMVIQEQGLTTLINAGDQLTAKLTVLPFLQQRGVNQIEWAIATNTGPGFERGWSEILKKLPVKNFHDIPNLTDSPDYQPILSALQAHRVTHLSFQGDNTISLASTRIKLIRTDPVALQLQIGSLTWLLLNDFKSAEQAAWITTADLPEAEVLWWAGKNLTTSVVSSLQPKVVVASSSFVNSETIAQLQGKNTQLHWTGRDGAVQWTPSRSFTTTLNPISSVDGKLN
jgi:competence protein ComEC